MTLAELERAVKSIKRVKLEEARKQANFDYQLANLIGVSISRIYSNSARFPDISEVYPSLFDAEEIEDKKQEKRNELSALRFKQFAQMHNKRFLAGGEKTQ